MTQKTPQQALQAYDDLYKVPNEDRYIIDGDEAQVAADLATHVREQVRRQQEAETITRDAIREILDDFRSEDEALAPAKAAFLEANPTVKPYQLDDLIHEVKQVARKVHTKELIEQQEDEKNAAYEQGLEDRPLIDAAAAAVRGMTTFEPTRIIEAHRGDASMIVQLKGSAEYQALLLESTAADIREDSGEHLKRQPR